ncbi:phosphate signaling complex protein PhoU [Candidatus Aerophobetes bacterium]|nr:phosphate signaling complex protein PhoU [Candidatus Aerophobetes bacterium]
MDKRHFHQELSELNKEILKLGGMVEESISRSIESLKKRDIQLAKKVINSDEVIDKLELEIDERCINLLALYQPMAIDLRFITTALMITTDLERIADLAVDISERTIELADKPLLKPLIDVPKLASLAQKMVRESLEAFVNRNAELAMSVCKYDDEADHLRDMVCEEIVEIVKKDGTTAPRAIPLLLVARHLERICDHATNIAEDVVYMVEAQMLKHHPRE